MPKLYLLKIKNPIDEKLHWHKKFTKIYLVQCDQIWRDFAALVKYSKYLAICFRVHLVLGQILSLFWQKIYALGHIYIVLNGQILNQYYRHLVTLLHSLPSNIFANIFSCFKDLNAIYANYVSEGFCLRSSHILLPTRGNLGSVWPDGQFFCSKFGLLQRWKFAQQHWRWIFCRVLQKVIKIGQDY